MKKLLIILLSVTFLVSGAIAQDSICGNVYKGYIVVLSGGVEDGSVINHVDHFFIDTIPKFSKKGKIGTNSFLEQGGVLIDYDYFSNKFGNELYESKILKHFSHYDPYFSQKIKDKYIDYYRVVIVGNIKDTTILSYAARNGQHGTSHSKTFIDVEKALDRKFKILFPDIVIPW